MAGLLCPPECSPLWAKPTGRSPNTSSFPQECPAECCFLSACPVQPQTLQPRLVHLHQKAIAGLRRPPKYSLLWAKPTGRSPNTSSTHRNLAECCQPSAGPLQPQTLQPRPVHLHQIAMAGLRRPPKCSLLWAKSTGRAAGFTSMPSTPSPCYICAHVYFALSNGWAASA